MLTAYEIIAILLDSVTLLVSKRGGVTLKAIDQLLDG